MKTETMDGARAKLDALVREKLAATRAAGSPMDERTARSAAMGQLEWDLQQARDNGDTESGELLELIQKWNVSDPAERAARLLGSTLQPVPRVQSEPPRDALGVL